MRFSERASVEDSRVKDEGFPRIDRCPRGERELQDSKALRSCTLPPFNFDNPTVRETNAAAFGIILGSLQTVPATHTRLISSHRRCALYAETAVGFSFLPVQYVFRAVLSTEFDPKPRCLSTKDTTLPVAEMY